MKKIFLSSLLVLCMLFALTGCSFLFSDTEQTSAEEAVTVNIECPETLKFGVKAGKTYSYSECKVDNVRYSTSGKSLKITYDVTKTYDQDGEMGDTAVYFKYILYGSDGSIIKNGTVYHSDMMETQKLKDETFSISLESFDSSYRLVFIDYTY